MTEFSACKRAVVDTVMIKSAQDMLTSMSEEIQQRTQVFAMLGNEVRLSIVLLLLYKERMCVCDLADILKMKQSPISQHLRKLKDAGILVNKREGMTVYYSVVPVYRTWLESCIRDTLKGDDDGR